MISAEAQREIDGASPEELETLVDLATTGKLVQDAIALVAGREARCEALAAELRRERAALSEARSMADQAEKLYVRALCRAVTRKDPP